MPTLSPFRLVTFVSLCVISLSSTHAQQSIDLNFGLSASKSVLGVSYTSGKNQVNIGLRGFAYSGRDGVFLQPGLSYNRYLAESGFYAWVAYIAEYQSDDIEGFVRDPVTGTIGYQVVERKGWYPGFALTGLGKSWQFTRWGLHADAGLSTPADSRFATKVGLYLGGGASYRFRLGE